jgi:hypothetical protein
MYRRREEGREWWEVEKEKIVLNIATTNEFMQTGIISPPLYHAVITFSSAFA